MTDTIAWTILGWMLPITLIAFCTLATLGCIWIACLALNDMIRKIKVTIRRRKR